MPVAEATVPPLSILTESEREIAENVYQWAAETIGPRSLAMDQANRMDPELVRQFFDLDLMGIEIPEEYGGLGQNFGTAIAVIEALARVDAACAVVVDVQNTLVANAILRWASPELKAKYLPQLAKSKVGSYALSEAESGSDAFALKTKAEKKGDRWLLNGGKLWITNGLESEIFLVFANVDFAKGYRGITAFLVESGWNGFTKGKKEDKLGIRASSTLALAFEDLEVPEENVVGKVGEGYKIAIETLNEGRIGIGSQMLGVARAALDYSAKYVQTRVQFGKPISEFQSIQNYLADMATEIDAARLLTWRAGWMKDRGMKVTKESAMCKLYAGEVSVRVANLAVQVHGGYGFTKDFRAEKFYRDVKLCTIGEGTSEIQRMVIARQLLKG